MSDLLRWMASGYLITLVVETPVLVLGLSRRHALRVRAAAAAWLTACTYPVVWLVLPPWFADRATYLCVAETFAPVAECALFWLVSARHAPSEPRSTARDLIAVTTANLASFGFGELLVATGVWVMG